MNIFVDCDDTLLLYRSTRLHNPYGYWHGIAYLPNTRLIQGIVQFRLDNPESKIVIWSGGGGEYAKECATHLGIASICDSFLVKDTTNFHLIQSGDVVVDDDDLDQIRTHEPDAWPEDVPQPPPAPEASAR